MASPLLYEVLTLRDTEGLQTEVLVLSLTPTPTQIVGIELQAAVGELLQPATWRLEPDCWQQVACRPVTLSDIAMVTNCLDDFLRRADKGAPDVRHCDYLTAGRLLGELSRALNHCYMHQEPSTSVMLRYALLHILTCPDCRARMLSQEPA